LAEFLVDSVSISPAGTVVFLQSYSYKDKFVNFLKEKGFYENIENYKKIFEENNKEKGEESPVFQAYSDYIMKQHKPALLFCIIGGKLSEGINFSDDLARVIIVAGLPYPSN